MAKYYATSPLDGLVPLKGDTLMEAIADATSHDWKFNDGTIPIFDGTARPIAWIDPEDCAWTLTPPPTWWPSQADTQDARDAREAREKEKNIRH